MSKLISKAEMFQGFLRAWNDNPSDKLLTVACDMFLINEHLPRLNKINAINEAIAKQQDVEHQGDEVDQQLITAYQRGKYLTDLQVARLLYVLGADVSTNAVDNINNLAEHLS